jgi:AsmA protein
MSKVALNPGEPVLNIAAMKATLKWAGLAVVCLAVVMIAALLIIPAFVDVKQFKAPLEKYLSEASGRPVSVGDDVRLSLFPWARVSFSDVRLGNIPGFVEKEFAMVKSFEVRIRLLPLLSREVQVDRLSVNEPRIFMVKNKDGRVSWDFGGSGPETKPPAAAPKSAPGAMSGLPITSLAVGELSLQNGSVVLIDHGTGSRHDVSGLNILLKDVTLDRPVRIAISALIHQKPVSAEGRFGPVGANLGQGAVPFEFKVNAFNQMNLQLNGSVENLLVAPRVNVTLNVAEFSPRKLMAEIGQALPAAADPRVLERLALTAVVKAEAKAVTLSGAVLSLDDSKLSFAATATEFSKPNLAFDLNLDHIDIDRYLPPKAPAAAGQPADAKPAAPRRQTDYGPLRTLVLNGTAKIGKLSVNQAKLEDVNLKVTARDGILSLDPFAMKLYQGTVSGKSVVNVKGASPVTDLQLTVDKLQVNPLLKNLAGKDFLEGATRAQIALSMTGDDPARIQQTLNGKGSLDFTDGAIVGVDLAGMVRDVKAGLRGKVQSGPKPRTDFSELAVPFTLQNGVFHTSDAAMKSPLLRLSAAGKADLVKESLDFRIDPKLVGTIKGQGDEKDRSGLGVPIVVTGSFDQPIFLPDVEAMAKDQLKKALGPSDTGGAKVKEKARDVIKGILPTKN